jgi:hypothetical protein
MQQCTNQAKAKDDTIIKQREKIINTKQTLNTLLIYMESEERKNEGLGVALVSTPV